MGRPTSKKNLGLGRALLNDKLKGTTRGGNPSSRHATDSDNYGSNANLRSVTQERALDEFLSTAELANTDFTAEKMNVKIISNDQFNPYLLTPEQEAQKKAKHNEFKQSLTVPRRPPWDSKTTPTELDRNEKEAFLEWRRHLAQLQEEHDLLLTPFERNLEVWRQLWRVIERSDLIVQIVDARDPLLFRSTDLESYVKEIDSRKRNLLLVNKADLMTERQRRSWAAYFHEHDIHFSFFSAALAKEENERLTEQTPGDRTVSNDQEDDQDIEDDETEDRAVSQIKADIPMSVEQRNSSDVDEEDLVRKTHRATLDEQDTENDSDNESVSTDHSDDEAIRILTIDELEELFLSAAPAPLTTDDGRTMKTSIGLVGYPNVGKSSTINALVGAKTVSVSSTPGKTKHFQTIQLSDAVTLVDCPGLVFPNFASSQADLVCAGVLPIDQLREYSGPAALVAKRIPQRYIEEIYGIAIHTRAEEEGGTGIPTAEELLVAYALSRGFTKAGQGNPDESRAARFVLKDYVAGKLLYVEPPPNAEDGESFNREIYNLEQMPQKKKAPMSHVPPTASTYIHRGPSEMSRGLHQQHSLSGKVDSSFFEKAKPVNAGIKGARDLAARGARGTVNGKVIMYPFQVRLNEDGSEKSDVPQGKMLTGRKARLQAALDQGIDPQEASNSKKHFKGMSKQKTRPVMY
ncbi:putative Ribosome biogenesis GTPase Lsg1 [Taphrina deformans PYCC 5710]|uniref:Ribosome biogenesis GTPase Lsg1 n=1 Tax=Taphrina deformans (strain PYCC 5710 / ATCC 11124 / CBS 356.35 / IMI 108563 / JCM 9778 / NBRC 8474) TaxID=1097556 RepID=R4X8F1_TAPDE|nr:putative Ribosome biogenesis GTPase Lsg1 [Taphrina deformans PYCC 5710]|eukprot:CCG81874.1 putative Ribosome biogenesis GTPase Lsg1 [Taphrina deformans PYCC 5710]